MGKKKRRSGVLLLASLLILALLAACGGGNNGGGNQAQEANGAGESPKPADSAAIDTSKKVELQLYMLGNAPKDLSMIESEINKMAEEELNTTVKFNYTTWTDWDQKYKLLLSTGQSIDLIYTADWTQYSSYAKKGAFMALDDLLPKTAPELQKFVPADFWDAVKVDGKIYTMPATYKEFVTGGFTYRKDLQEKHNLPVPTDLASYEQFLLGIQKSEPNILPVFMNSDMKALHWTYMDLNKSISSDVPYGLNIKYEDPANVIQYWGSPEMIEELKLYKKWQDLGLIPKNVLNSKDDGTDVFPSGKAASVFGLNPTKYNDAKMKMEAVHPEWDLAYVPYATTTKIAPPVHPIHNGFAVPKNSKNPERALAFYEKLVLDKRYNQLTQYGMEGTHYNVESGYYKMVGTSNTNGFPREAMNGWAWRNPEYMLFDKSYDNIQEIFDELDQYQTPDKFLGFAEDFTAYQAEKAALEQVEKQYLYPLYAGLVDDVEQGVALFMEKAKQAGLEKIQTEYTKQWLAYVEESGIAK
ncbi:extracellular solute-binding protein [Paenibacillus sanguinis]|uniref:extracellular solute-binding protein n=1 Tax=Paenibacillus sanguinis TaxID=225906 RepID=UPI000366D823|nr:extracellular solute-binding protein [Paenibacillus sanguinis]